MAPFLATKATCSKLDTNFVLLKTHPSIEDNEKHFLQDAIEDDAHRGLRFIA